MENTSFHKIIFNVFVRTVADFALLDDFVSTIFSCAIVYGLILVFLFLTSIIDDSLKFCMT